MTQAADSGKLHVLIAEDNHADACLIQEALREHGFNFHAEIAADGEEALDFLRRATGAGDPPLDLVLLDLNLGTHHGADVLAYIRQTPPLIDVPVVVLTSSDSPRDRERVRTLGANLYIRKPMDLEAFFKIGEQIATVLR